MKKWQLFMISICVSLAILIFYFSDKGKHKKDIYECVPNDPMKTRIYTLENGLKVYLSINKKEPRIQANIVVRVGSKNDPAETTGLAHYLEHLMFKGTKQYGSIDYEKEKPYLDKIEELYEIYRKTTDDQKRKDIYKQIDELSYEASKYAIANEYNKLMNHLGSQGSNAWTSNDSTCYTENIPANQIDNWAKIQSDRFKNMIIRGFHTELEAVYEEYNYRVQDQLKMYEKTNEILFSNHPYGLQTTIGKQEHLKNPSIKNIKEFFKKWYVPNNIAICMSGDLDYDKTINIIKKYFSDWKPNPNIKRQHETIEKIKVTKLQEPKIAEVFGNESESIMISWVIPGLRDNDLYQLDVLANILSNRGNIGLIDIDILQKQKVLSSYVGYWPHNDYSSLHIIACPKEGQTPEEVKSLLLDEITKLKNGDFDYDLIESIINNLKLEHTKNLENNAYRVDNFIDSFISQHEWKYSVDNFNRLKKLTKEDIIKWANKYLTNGYACVYKRKGIDTNEKKIDKPEITPIITNSDKTSQFAESIMNNKVEPIEPIFIDYQKDITVKTYDNGDEILYKHKEDNDLFELEFIIYKGTKLDNTLGIALDYLSYLGTSTSTNNELKKEFYKLACNIETTSEVDRTVIKLSGLSNNMEQALRLTYKWLIDAKSDKKIYDNVIEDIINYRQVSKSRQNSNLLRLIEYGKKGNINECTNIPSIDELKSMNPQILLDKLLKLLKCQKTILYYGALKLDQVEEILQMELSQNQLEKTDKYNYYYHIETPQNEVLLAPYDAKNTYLCVYSNTNQKYDITLTPYIYIFTEYFRNCIFKDIREKRGLAYMIWGAYFNAFNKMETNNFYIESSIQNDKLYECLNAINDVVDNMLIDEGNFNIAKNAVINSIVTKRFTGIGVLYNYLNNNAKGLSESEDIYVYDHIKNISLKDFTQFYEKYIKNCKRKYMILSGDKKYINIEKLKSFGQVKELMQNDIFGY